MKYIDKYRFADEAHAVNVLYLQDCYQGADSPMIPSVDSKQSFEDFKKYKYRYGNANMRGWEKLLIEEQEGRCCYCMRSLIPGKMNFEHVVPKSLGGVRGASEYGQYAAFAPAIKDYVMIADQFAQKSFATQADIDNEQKMPHITAEANLLAACNGKWRKPETGCCCNNFRQDAFVVPLMLMKDCQERVDYDENGLVSVFPEEPTLKTIVNELNDETFTQVRRIWYKISRTAYSLDEVKLANGYVERVMILKAAFGVANFENDLPNEIKKFARLEGNLQSTLYWDLLLSYDWFYHFYQNRRAET